ncbi:hypothetical protein GC194_01435 [bacterium]|nr:hypothetical protein [bacterium]
MSHLNETPEFSLKQVRKILEKLSKDYESNFKKGNVLYINGATQILSKGGQYYEVAVQDEYKDHQVSIAYEEGLQTKCSCKTNDWCSHQIASMLQVAEFMASDANTDAQPEGKTYTREGMIKRVMEERKAKAQKADYKLSFNDNKFGEHLLVNERGVRYKITLRDFEHDTGYCNCPDHQTNKLGTCKHLMYAFDKIDKKLKKQSHDYPFIELYLDPLNDYKISWYYQGELPTNELALLNRFFGQSQFVEETETLRIFDLIKEAEINKLFKIRPEVLGKVEEAFDRELLNNLQAATEFDYSNIKATLYNYQKKGVEFATFKKGAIIADEMGLGKTIQAITTAVFKKKYLGFSKALIICPASLKGQWKSEIEKFCDESAQIIEGFPDERAALYNNDTCYFSIINYETVLRDLNEINKAGYDFVVLDEAQRIKNFETLTATAIKGINKKHALAITGTPIENHLIDLYAIVEFLYPHMLTPLWEFSYQHCYFDTKHNNKITGYYNLNELKERLKTILLRREKADVLTELNEVTQIDVPIEMHEVQRDYHASAAYSIAAILHKKFKTAFDWQRILSGLQTMRMACDSSFLVDKETHHSPKLDALEEILMEKLDIKNNQRKIIIFSEWRVMNGLIGKMLRKNNIGYTELNGSVPVKKRKKLVEEFEQNPKCRVFLSTESGGAGLNLQVADTVINFELPWNPAKKNQRIGRIDRLGQTNKKLTVLNLITRNSIEMSIASGLALKQNLFDNVLNKNFNKDFVDFSEKGKGQFLKDLELAMAEFAQNTNSDIEENDELLQLTEEHQTLRKEEEASTKERIKKLEEMESVMQKGMDFLAGIFKMNTGKDLNQNESKIEIDKETGEVVMRFKF